MKTLRSLAQNKVTLASWRGRHENLATIVQGWMDKAAALMNQPGVWNSIQFLSTTFAELVERTRRNLHVRLVPADRTSTMRKPTGGSMITVVTLAELKAACKLSTKSKRKQLEAWGESWPPVRGWRKRLLGRGGINSAYKAANLGAVETTQPTTPRCRKPKALVIFDKSEDLNQEPVNTNEGLVAFFDGACVPNPHGRATCSATIQRDGVRIATLQHHVGTGQGMTNNVAEFAGVQLILSWLIQNNITGPMTICGDSLIAIKRMRSRTLPTGLCRELAGTCLAMARDCKGQITYRWVPRELNTVRDELADEVMHCHTGTSTTPLSVDEADCMSYVPACLLNGNNDLPYWNCWEMAR